MNKVRVIARLDIKNQFVIKGIQLEGLRKIGNPNVLAKKYYQQGVDEIIFMDSVAAYYDRNSLSHIVEKTCQDVFIPITVGGGIRCVEDIEKALISGADKVAINTKAVQTPDFITQVARMFGSQCIVLSVDAKQTKKGQWQVYVDNGREPTGIDVIDWVKQGEALGAGEILLTSIDKDGTKKGFDQSLNAQVSHAVRIPVIASGGCGVVGDAVNLLSNTNIDALAIASMFHYQLADVDFLKESLDQQNISVRL